MFNGQKQSPRGVHLFLQNTSGGCFRIEQFTKIVKVQTVNYFRKHSILDVWKSSETCIIPDMKYFHIAGLLSFNATAAASRKITCIASKSVHHWLDASDLSSFVTFWLLWCGNKSVIGCNMYVGGTKFSSNKNHFFNTAISSSLFTADRTWLNSEAEIFGGKGR